MIMMLNLSFPFTCILWKDRFWRVPSISLLTITPPVMMGPPSFGAWMGTGMRSKSTSSPSVYFHDKGRPPLPAASRKRTWRSSLPSCGAPPPILRADRTSCGPRWPSSPANIPCTNKQNGVHLSRDGGLSKNGFGRPPFSLDKCLKCGIFIISRAKIHHIKRSVSEWPTNDGMG